MTVEFWALGGVLIGVLAAWLAYQVREAWGTLDEWWTPKSEPATLAQGDAVKLRGEQFRRDLASKAADQDVERRLRDANRSNP